MPNRPVLGQLRSGEVVVGDADSHLHPPVHTHLWEALAWVRSEGRAHFVDTYDHGGPIGDCLRVRTAPEDEIVYAQRPGRAGLTRFVKNRRPEPSSQITVVLRRSEAEEEYVCLSAWIGGRAEPEPWDENRTERSAEFWSHHALVWGSMPVIAGTETTVRPW
jgi:hypothetical protein